MVTENDVKEGKLGWEMDNCMKSSLTQSQCQAWQP